MIHLVAIILGLVEGLTEFIPVSSSGHLIIVHKLFGRYTDLLGNGDGGLAFDAVLQLTASCALFVFFWSDVRSIIKTFFTFVAGKVIEGKDKVLILSIIFATVPALFFGLVLEGYIETVFRDVRIVALMLILGSVLFWYAQKKASHDKVLSIGRGITIGFFQCLALIPGVSRSGATISGGLLNGLSQEEAVRYSFLLSLPILFGAGLKKFFDIRHMVFGNDASGLVPQFGIALLLGSITAFITSLLAINFLIKYLKTHNLTVFIWYRVILAILLIVLL